MKKIKKVSLLVFGMVALYSCTNLNEIVLDEYNAAGLTDKQAAEGAIVPVYAFLPNLYRHTIHFALNEISTDEAKFHYHHSPDLDDNGI